MAALPLVAFVSLAQYPLGISYFNAIGGPPEKAWFYLADSNIDWGQNLPQLGRVAQQQQIQWIQTYYFGNDHPRRFLDEKKYKAVAPPWSAEFAQGEVLEPKPGLYAISVNMLTGHFFAPKYRHYFARFRTMKPYAVAGGGIFVYLVDYQPKPR